VLRQDVDNLPFAFVAPLDAYNDRSLALVHGRLRSEFGGSCAAPRFRTRLSRAGILLQE
jgi:hypothetical protein